MSESHGGIDYQALAARGIPPDDVKDFSVSINPAPLPAAIQEIIRESALHRYPDSRSLALVEALAEEYGASVDGIMAVNGTSQAIYLIACAYLKPGETTLIAGPTFSEYSDAASIVGARIVELRAEEHRGFRPGMQALIRAIRREKPRVFWICSPNNPTGAWLEKSDIDDLARACTDAGCLMVLDEAYRCFAPPGLLEEKLHPGVVHLRSMTKDFCIPGLRLGWIGADADVIRKLMRRQPEWSVSAPAQDAGKACLGELEYFRKSWAETRRETERMAAALSRLGFKVYPSAANFLLVKIGTDAEVKALSARLWEHLIQVRDCASFDLMGFIRIGTRSTEDGNALLAILADSEFTGRTLP